MANREIHEKGNFSLAFRDFRSMTNQFDFSYSGLLPDVITPK